MVKTSKEMTTDTTTPMLSKLGNRWKNAAAVIVHDIRVLPENFRRSAGEIKKLQKLVFCGLMAAIAIILSATTTIKLGPYLRIGFSAYPHRIVDYLFGPVVGIIFGGMMDVLSYFLADGEGMFFFGYTFNAMLAGLICGVLLYRKPVQLWRIVVAQFLLKMLVNVVLGTLWSSMLYGYGFMAILPARLIKNLVQWPVDSAILYVILQTVSKTVKRVWHDTI